MDDLNPAPSPHGAIDLMMCPKGLPIVVPSNLQKIQMPTNLPKFFGSAHEDPTTLVERFEELLVSSSAISLGHYLI